MFLEEFLTLGSVPSGFDLVRGRPVLSVEVKVALRMEVPKGEDSVSAIRLKRVFRKAVMCLSKITLLCCSFLII